MRPFQLKMRAIAASPIGSDVSKWSRSPLKQRRCKCRYSVEFLSCAYPGRLEPQRSEQISDDARYGESPLPTMRQATADAEKRIAARPNAGIRNPAHKCGNISVRSSHTKRTLPNFFTESKPEYRLRTLARLNGKTCLQGTFPLETFS